MGLPRDLGADPDADSDSSVGVDSAEAKVATEGDKRVEKSGPKTRLWGAMATLPRNAVIRVF